MANNTILQQGRFTSDGAAKNLNVRSDIDWMKVYNYTQAGALNDVGLEFYWQRGMADDTGLITAGADGANYMILDALASGGFTLVDQSSQPQFGAEVDITSNTDATQPVFTVASTASLATGDVVRVSQIDGAVSLNGYEFEIEVINGTTFKPRYALANAPGSAGTGGVYRLRNRNPIYSPQRHLIADISQANPAVVTLSEGHSYSVGDFVRFDIPSTLYGDFNTNWNGLSAKITAVGTETLTLDVSSSALEGFPFPIASDYPFTFASLGLYGGSVNASTDNSAQLQMKLAGGANSPGGASSDVMYWVAGKSFSVDNE